MGRIDGDYPSRVSPPVAILVFPLTDPPLDRLIARLSGCGGRGHGPAIEGLGLDYFTVSQAARAYLDANRAAADAGARGVKVGIPFPFRDVMGVAHVTADDGTFTTDVADSTHNSPPKTYTLYQGK